MKFCQKLSQVVRVDETPSVNGSSTILHKPKFVNVLCEHEKNFALCVDRFLHVCEPHTCYLHFCIFSIWTDQCLLSAHWRYGSSHIQGKLIYCAPSANCMRIHNVIKVCSVCKALYYVHTPASLHLSKACIIAQAVMQVTYVLLHAAWLELVLHSSKACLITQASTQLMSTFVHFYVHQRHMS